MDPHRCNAEYYNGAKRAFARFGEEEWAFRFAVADGRAGEATRAKGRIPFRHASPLRLGGARAGFKFSSVRLLRCAMLAALVLLLLLLLLFGGAVLVNYRLSALLRFRGLRA